MVWVILPVRGKRREIRTKVYQIDKLSYDSPLAGIHPGEKAVFFIISLIMVLISRTLLIPVGVFLVAGTVLLWKGRVRPVFLLKLILIPLVFILSAVLPVLVSMSTGPFNGGRVLIENHLYWGIIDGNGARSLHLLFRSLSGVMCFLFFILTTPIGQIDSLLGRMRISATFREMLILIYRFIFLLSDISSDVYRSQKARRGYAGFSVSLNSLGHLCRALFQKTDVYSSQAALALQARSCEGIICFIQPPSRGRMKIRILIGAHLLILLTLFWIEEQWLI